MCKHILFTNFKIDQDLETLKSFAEMSYEQDGYGAIIRTKKKNIYTLKSLNQGEFYITLTQFLLKNKNSIETLVVHHRTSTNKDGIEYCHPFEHKGHYLTHNGVIRTQYLYDTKTTNDSEELLHHLIESNYNTKEISGYFSAFLISANNVQIIVDNTAPIWTNGRIYSSHNLTLDNDIYTKIVKKHIQYDNKGNMKSSPIELMISDYGRDLAYLSLGTSGAYKDSHNMYEDDYEAGPYQKNVLDYSSKANKKDDLEHYNDFISMLTDHEHSEFKKIVNIYDLEDAIWTKAVDLGLYLDINVVDSLVDHYLKND